MQLAKHSAEERRFSNVELRVQALASRQARKQLLQVPWSRFHQAYEEYPRWQSLSLWSQAVINVNGRAPSGVSKEIQERCPGFFQGEVPACEPSLLALRLLEWVHNQRFGYAKRQGWLNALTFYGVRHLRSQAAWAFWEHCENEWSERRPKAFPSFKEWWQSALKIKLCGEASYLDVAPAVERYIDWEAITLWLRPLFAHNMRLPMHVVSELERRLRRVSSRPHPASGTENEGKTASWRSLVRTAKEYCLSEAKGAGWLDGFMERVRCHPRHVRVIAYGQDWTKRRSANPSDHFQSFREWQKTFEQYVTASPSHGKGRS